MRLLTILSYLLPFFDTDPVHSSYRDVLSQNNESPLRNAKQAPLNGIPELSKTTVSPGRNTESTCSRKTTVITTTTAFVVLHGRLPEITVGPPLIASSDSSSSDSDSMGTTTFILANPTSMKLPSALTELPTQSERLSSSTANTPIVQVDVVSNMTSVVKCWEGGGCASTYDAINKCFAKVPGLQNSNNSIQSNDFQDCFCNIMQINEVK